MTPEEEAAEKAAEAIRKLKAEIEELTKSSEYLRAGFKTLKPDTWGEKFIKGVNASIYKSMSNAGRAAEEEAVRQSKKRGESELQQDAARARARLAADEKSARVAYRADEALTGFGKGIGKSVGAVGGFARAMGEGEQGFRSLTPIIDAAASAFSGIPILSGAVKAAAEASKFMINQLQNATDAFHDISKVGGLTARGMDGLQEQFLRSGMQLKAYTKTVTENSAALANFAGNVGKGAERFSDTAGIVQDDFGIALQRLGFQIDEIGEYTASYIARQTQLGLSQNRTNAQLAAGAAGYAKELDTLSKLTGASRKELEKQQDAALSESRFRAQYDDMVANGQEKQAKAMLDFQSLVNKIAPEMAQGLRDVSTGFTNSEAAIKLYNSTSGAGQEIMERLKNGQIDQVQAYKELQAATKNNMETQRFQARAVGDSNVFVKYAEGSKLVASQMSDLGEVLDTQKKQIEAPTKLTEQTVDAQRNMQQLSIEMQKLGFTFMPEAAKAVNSFTGALNKLLKLVSEQTGGPSVSVGGSAPTGGAANRRRAAANQTTGAAATGAAAPGAELGEGPVFGRPDTTRIDKVQLTLEDIREELKKLVKMGAISGGSADMTAAMNAHDRSHQHEPPTITPEAARELGQGVGSPLKNLMVTSGFGMRTDPITGKQAGHGGVDLAGKIGDAIMAPESGIARVVGEAQSGGYGNMVEILNEQGKVIHRLAHMSETMIKTGDKIAAGTEIGKVGSTGRSTGAHLHWEQFDPTTGKQIDPMAALAARQGRGAPQVAGRAPGGATDMNTYMRTVAMLESGGNPNVKAVANGAPSSAGGLFGFLESSWKGLGGTNAADRFDPAKSTEMMAKFSAQQKTQMEKNLGRQVSGSDLYMAHFLGAGGATNFFKQMGANPMASAAAAMPAAAGSNKSIFYNKEGGERSFQEVYQLMTEKYKKQEANVLAGNIPALVSQITGGAGMLAPGGLAGPTGVPSPVAVGPGGTGALPAAPGVAPTAQPATVMAAQDNVMLQQLVVLNQQQNTLLGRILQTSQA